MKRFNSDTDLTAPGQRLWNNPQVWENDPTDIIRLLIKIPKHGKL